MKHYSMFLLAACLGACTINQLQPQQQGLLTYDGRQADIVSAGMTDGIVPIAAMSGHRGAYGVGAYAGLDGEVTIIEGRPYVTQIRGDGFSLSNSSDGAVIFGVWTTNTRWQDEPVPTSVSSYEQLQVFIQQRAQAAGIDTATTPFPFLLKGVPEELVWHINVDRTEGRPMTRELFQQSKQTYVMRHQAVTITGFYSEQHHGVFIGTYAPAITDPDLQNALHMHLV
jgi:acetolactate decarboxylase